MWPALYAQTLGSVRPVRKIGATRSSTAKISFLDFRFQEPYFGREGPNYAPQKGEPSGGAQQLAEARLFGNESIATLKFEMADESGQSIRSLHFIKTDDSLASGEYLGLVDVPLQPFRIVVSGQDVNGAPFRAVYSRVFRPKGQPPAQLVLPPGMPAQHAAKLKAGMDLQDQQMKARFEEVKRVF